VFFVCRGHASLLATLDRELKKVDAWYKRRTSLEDK
jgi:hypothetical protein